MKYFVEFLSLYRPTCRPSDTHISLMERTLKFGLDLHPHCFNLLHTAKAFHGTIKQGSNLMTSFTHRPQVIHSGTTIKEPPVKKDLVASLGHIIMIVIQYITLDKVGHRMGLCACRILKKVQQNVYQLHLDDILQKFSYICDCYNERELNYLSWELFTLLVDTTIIWD